MIIFNDCLSIDKGYKFEDFKLSTFYNNQKDNRFFVLDGVYKITGIDGKFRVGLWFNEGVIKQIQMCYIDDIIENEKVREKQHNLIISNIKKMDLKSTKIFNYWDKREGHSTIIINF
ncbi:MAG: hypothetical protein K2M73_02470 [Lachnospiraceae bacterium]|nr:hypothetical protein [Lachnospiraceae bacterium]